MGVEFFKHNVGEEDIARVVDVLHGSFLTTGKVVEEFEEKFASYLRCRYVVGVSSCTAALHLSLLALSIGPGDEVITTPMTFVATSNSILYTGAKPIFVDVNYNDGLINPNEVIKVLSPNTKALIPVHLCGQMCDMHTIKNIANEFNLRIVEDSAHAIEASYIKWVEDYGGEVHQPGRVSGCACFSFYPTKSITSGEGGAIATNSKELADKVRVMRNQGMTRSAADRYGKKYQHWDMEVLGYNYRMANIQAALLLGQLDRIDEYCDRRREICRRYEEAFRDNPKIRLLEAGEGSARLMFTILVDNRDEVLWKLQEKDIGVAVNYRPIHLLTYYKEMGYKRGDFPIAEEIGNKTVTLPLYPKLKDEEVEHVIKSISEVVG